MLKKKIHFYNGKEKKFIFTEKLHVGLRLGEFCFTRKVGVNHKKKLLIKKTKK
jgi:ribosomal protein S19